MNRYVQPMFVRPSGYAASNLIPWPAVAQNHAAIAYYQRVLVNQNETPSVAALRVDGLWGPNTQRELAAWQAVFNTVAVRQGEAETATKYGFTRVRTDGVLDEATQRALQISGQYNGVPRGNFPVGSAASSTTPAPSTSKPQLSPMNNYVGGGSAPAASTPAPTTVTAPAAPLNFTPVAAPTETGFPWGTAAIVGGVALLLGAGVWAATTPKRGRR